MSTRRFVTLEQAAREICDGDLLLFRSRGLVAHIIARAGRSPYTHAARALWWDGDLFCGEVRQWHGGRVVTLASQLERAHGEIDVYEVNPGNRWRHYRRGGATRFMRRLAGCRYGYRSVLQAAARHAPLWRWLVPPRRYHVESSGSPPFCSEACALADRLGGGVDPTPQLADRLTEPGDLARSPFYRYRLTLLPAPSPRGSRPWNE
jgi:hypothetical protein